jgi:hypothetical protein
MNQKYNVSGKLNQKLFPYEFKIKSNFKKTKNKIFKKE